MIKDIMDKQIFELRKLWMNKRQLLFQLLNLAMIVFSALMIWKGLMFVTQSESPVVVVLSEPDDASHWHDDLNHLVGAEHVVRFHSWEILPYEFRHPGPESVGRRLEALWRCLAPDPPILLANDRPFEAAGSEG